MKTAPLWSAILFPAARTYSAQPVGLKTGDRVYQALPVDTFRKTTETVTPEVSESAPVMATEIRQVTVKPGDVLAMKAQPGDYYWKIARRFAKESTIGAYAKDLIARNGGSSVVKAGQLLNLPVTGNSDYELELAIAVQKVVQLRSLFGQAAPQLDWGSAEVTPGPVDSYWVSFREAGGAGGAGSAEKRQRFMVSEDLSGLHPGRYSVLTEREALKYFPN